MSGPEKVDVIILYIHIIIISNLIRTNWTPLHIKVKTKTYPDLPLISNSIGDFGANVIPAPFDLV